MIHQNWNHIPHALSVDVSAKRPGAAAVLRYGETFDDVDLIVNMAGRFDTSQTPRSRFTEEQWKQLEETGSFVWTVKVWIDSMVSPLVMT